MHWGLPACYVPGIFQARILEWTAISFSRGSSRLRNWTHVSCIGRWILYHWVTWEALSGLIRHQIPHATWKMFFAKSYHWVQFTVHFPFLIPECLLSLPFSLVTKKKRKSSVMSDSATPWTVTYQAPPTMGFSGQEYWSGLPFPFPGDLPHPGIKPRSPAL